MVPCTFALVWDALTYMHVLNHPSFLLFNFQNNMAEGSPDPACQSSQNKSSCQQEEESAIIVEPDVTCGHCKKELNNPYLLCCLHSVCVECLPNMVVENGRLKCSKCGDTSTTWNEGKMSESECQKVDSFGCFPVPNGPLTRYMERRKLAHKVSKNTPIPCENRKCRRPDAHSTVFCFDCENFLCEHCHDAHEMMSAFDNHTVKALEEIQTSGLWDVTQISKSTSHIQCPQHRGKVLEYICEQCDLLMCQACAIDLKPPHNPKHISTKPKVADRHTQSIKIACRAVGSFVKKCEKVEKKFQSQIRTVDEMKEASLVTINTAFQTIHEAVEKRKEELRRQVITTAEEKKRTIRSKITTVQREKETSANAESSLHFLLSSGSSHDVLACKDLVRSHQSVVTSKGIELESTVSQVVTFDPTNQAVLLKAIEEFGIVESGACPANCTVEPKPESVQWNGSDPVTLTVTTFDRENIQCKRGGENVEAFLHNKSPILGPAIKARVVNDKNGRYTISFPSTYCGECDLYIRVNGSEIRGSPFVVNFLPSGLPKSGLPKLNKNVKELGANKGCLNYPQQGGGPWGIAVGQNGHIFVVDNGRHQVHVFNKQRKYIRSFGQQGSGNGQLKYPAGIAVDHDNRLYIGNQKNNRIEVVESEGTFVRQIGVGHLSQPWGVTVHNKHVYVTEKGNHRISVFTLDGQLIRTIGSQGSGPGQFNRTSAVAFAPDEEGDMYVLDYSNHRVQVFNANGVYQRQLDQGHLHLSLDIIVTADRHVIVADQCNSRVVIFNTMGQLIHSFQVGSYPYGLAIDHNGELLVSLLNTKQVAVF